MSYTDDAVLAKLSSLNETQESIVCSSFCLYSSMLMKSRWQWLNGSCFIGASGYQLQIMPCSNRWLPGDTQTAQDSYGYNDWKTLRATRDWTWSILRMVCLQKEVMIPRFSNPCWYHAAEVTQQSKNRGKDDFVIAFSPVIAEATASAYKGATNEVQTKIKRVVEVWRSRQIFETPIQEAVQARIDGTTPSNQN